MRFDHFGVAVGNIESAIGQYSKLGMLRKLGDKIYDRNQGVTLQMCDWNGMRIELISGEGVAGLVKDRHYWYHPCFRVKNFDETVKTLDSCGWILLKKSAPAVLFGGKRVAFYHTLNGIVEILEE